MTADGNAGFKDLQALTAPALWPRTPKPPVVQRYPMMLVHPEPIRTTYSAAASKDGSLTSRSTTRLRSRLRGYRTTGQFDPKAMDRSELPSGFVRRRVGRNAQRGANRPLTPTEAASSLFRRSTLRRSTRSRRSSGLNHRPQAPPALSTKSR
jgi:hypothetical protein